jgi:hypothetical protein
MDIPEMVTGRDILGYPILFFSGLKYPYYSHRLRTIHDRYKPGGVT